MAVPAAAGVGAGETAAREMSDGHGGHAWRDGGDTWRAAGFFVLRTPCLPVDALLALGDDLEGAAGRHQAAALDRDRARVLDRLRALCLRPDVREALLIASPSLEGRLDGWARDPDGAPRAGLGLLRYVARMAGRATPFGLFAGCSVGLVGDETRLRLPGREVCRRHTSLDGRYLDALAEALQRDPAVRRHLRYAPNSSLYRAAGRLRYTEARPAGSGTSFHLVAVEPSPHLDAALRRAEAGTPPGEPPGAFPREPPSEPPGAFPREPPGEPPGAFPCEPHGALSDELPGALPGALPRELAAAVRAADPEAGPDEAAGFVDELIDAQLLVCELTPAVCGPEPIDDVIGGLAGVTEPRARTAAAVLGRARAMLADLDRLPPGTATERYGEVAAALDALPVRPAVPAAFHVDLTKPAVATLGWDAVAEIERGVRVLHRVGGGRPGDLVHRFREAFRRRYGEREVPLCEALDDEIGIGFPAAEAPGAFPAPLLDGLAFPAPPGAGGTRFGRREALLLRRLSEAARTGASEIVLGEAELRALEEAGGGTDPMPDSFGVVATILAAGDEAVAAGRYRILLSSAGGPSGANLLGRFCRRDDLLSRHVRAHLRAEEALRPDAVFAEIVHRAPGKVGNVLVRPHLRDHEIVYLGRSAAPARRVPLTDLVVAVTGDRVVLRSRSLGREVLPRLTTAHRAGGAGSPALYRFLCGLAGQGVAGALSFSFGALEDAPHLPRITAGRLVLSRERWHLSGERLAALSVPTAAARFAAIQELRGHLRLPRWVAVADGDRRLPVDLDNVLFADMAADLFRGRASVRIEEVFFGPDDVAAAGPEGRFAHELVVPFLRAREPSAPAPPYRTPKPGERGLPPGVARPGRRGLSPHVARPVARSFPPGSEWLYAKLYTGPASADAVLQRVVRPVVRDAVSGGAADRWFFIRYADPDPHLRLRLHGDPARLMGEVLPALLGGCAGLHAEGTVWRTQLDTYEREVERYGGPDGIVLAERLFHADSDAALDAIAGVPGDGDARWRLALAGLDRLLGDLGLDLPGRIAVVGAARDRFGREFGADAAFARRLGARYRRERAALEALLGTEPPEVAAYAARSRALRSVAGDLAACARDGRLARPLTTLAGGFLHLHANRMLPSAARAQELVLYDFLHRWYRSRAARLNGAGAAAARPAAGAPR
ncbi:lantibiotic dehydratase [Sphaerisporangium dianthi]|uniref:Lantibiotic dehydratase n=1 Tax=Sphaerisporangium dianthi TaxID=1436120 RepID=A0ABV9CG15_9ACTN